MRPTVTMFLAAVLSWSVSAQQAAPPSLPPGSIDGSVDPEMIPDIVAVRLFLGAMTAADSGTPAALTKRQPGMVRCIGLSEADLNHVVSALQAFQSRITTAVSPAVTGKAAPEVDLDTIAQNTLDLLQSQMTTEGFQRLLKHIRAEKRHMKRVPYPAMDAQSMNRHLVH